MESTERYSPLPTLHADDQEILNYAGLLDGLDIGLMVFSSDAIPYYRNKAAEKLLGPEMPDWTDASGRPIADAELPMSIVRQTTKPIFDQQLALKNAVGGTIRLRINALPVFAGDNRLRRILLTLVDANRSRLPEGERADGQVVDRLTRVFTKQHVMSLLGNEIHRARRYGTPFTLAQLDIDNFVPFCNQYGQERGEQVLAGIGQLLKKSLREIDIVGRIGNDEFLLVLPNVSLNEALVGLERLRVAIETREFFDQALRVTISGGIAEHAGETAEALIERTRSLMVQARESGRNRYCLDIDIL